MGSRLSLKVRRIFRRGASVVAPSANCREREQQESSKNQPPYPAQMPPSSSGHPSNKSDNPGEYKSIIAWDNQNNGNRDGVRSDMSLNMRAKDSAENELQNIISIPGQSSYPTAQCSPGRISVTAGQGNSNQCDLNQPIWKNERQYTSLDMRVMDRTESELQEAISTIPGQPSAQMQPSAPGPLSLPAGHLDPSKKSSETSSVSALADQSSDQDYLKQQVEKSQKLDCIENELQGQHLDPSAQVQQSASRPESLLAEHLDPSNNLEKSSETSSTIAWDSQSNSSQDHMNHVIEKGEQSDALLDMKAMGHTESEMEETTIPGQPSHPSTQIPSSATGRKSISVENVDPSNNSVKSSETSSVRTWDSESNSSQDDLTHAIEKGKQSDTLLDMKAMGHTESEMEETTIPGQPSHPSTQIPSSNTGQESLPVENVDPSNNSVKTSETSSISTWDSYSSIDKNDLNEPVEKNEADTSLNIFSRLMPKQYEKSKREKVQYILKRWDVSGRLAEIEACVDGISHRALTIPGLVSALKQVEQCHLTSIEDHIALAYRVYYWVAKNISYTFHVNDTNPSVILKTKQAVCSGYASLFQKLAKEVGLSVIRVDGNTRKCLHPETVFIPQESNSHTWNMVRMSCTLSMNKELYSYS